MKNTKKKSIFAMTIVLITCLAISAPAQSQDPAGAPADRAQIQAQAQPEIDKHRNEAQQQAEKTLDKDAINAIQETEQALKAISDGKIPAALAAIERATGKINILTARNPATALIPVQLTVEVIDAAPLDLAAIKALAGRAEDLVEDKDYPGARVVLQGLVSEIRVRTHNLPLATYPIAMREAARLLDQNKPQEAKAALKIALNTLLVIDRVIPLPLALAEEAIIEAQTQRDKDKVMAQRLLATAKNELERAKELGYAGKDAEYASLNTAISDLERQLGGNSDTGSAFARLKEKVSSFFKRQSESEKRAEVARL